MKLKFLTPTFALLLSHCISHTFRLNQTFTEEEEFLAVRASNIQVSSVYISLPIQEKNITEIEFRNQIQNQIDRLSSRSVAIGHPRTIELTLISFNHKFTSDFIGLLLHFFTLTVYTFSGGVVMHEELTSEFRYYATEEGESEKRKYHFYFQCERPIRFSDNISRFQSAPEYGDFCRKKMIVDLAKNIQSHSIQ